MFLHKHSLCSGMSPARLGAVSFAVVRHLVEVCVGYLPTIKQARAEPRDDHRLLAYVYLQFGFSEYSHIYIHTVVCRDHGEQKYTCEMCLEL